MHKLIIKNILFCFIVFTLSNVAVNAQDKVGINNKDPQAALDIKSATNDSDKVMRVSANVLGVKNENSVFFVGKRVQNKNGETVYDLRKTTKQEIADRIASHIPSLSTIILTNSKKQTFPGGNGNVPVELDEVIINKGGTFYFVGPKNAIEITKGGEYNITAFVGFEEIKNHTDRDYAAKDLDGDIVVSIAINRYDESTGKPIGGFNNYVNYKRNVISKTSGKPYRVDNIAGAGIGASFSFTNRFNDHDRLRLQVNKVFYGKKQNLVIKERASSLTITRVSPL